MSVPITAFYAGVYALLLLLLAARVSGFRMNLRVGLGDGGHSELTRAIRVHGNSVEWMLPMLVLLLVAELNQANPLFLHTCGSIFLVARFAHAVGLSRASGESPAREHSGKKVQNRVQATMIDRVRRLRTHERLCVVGDA